MDDLNNVLGRNVEAFWESLEEYTLQDDPNRLFGPEIKVAQHAQTSLQLEFGTSLIRKLQKATEVLLDWISSD
jgi:hypothetical protein